MKITLADHYGMCFGVRDALRKTHEVAARQGVTILGQLVHNPVVRQNLARLGASEGELEDLASARETHVIITAHGAADRHREAWKSAGFQVTDTTCPLVRKAHTALAQLVAQGFAPLIIGQRGHVEVRGLMGDFPEALVVENEADIAQLEEKPRWGVVSQTTQPVEKVRRLVAVLRERFPTAQIEFRDTVCQPTKDRQEAMQKLCAENEVIVVVGGRNSNNTRQLVLAAERNGRTAHQVETAADLRKEWFRGVEKVGLTAGTSTLDETVRDVLDALRRMG